MNVATLIHCCMSARTIKSKFYSQIYRHFCLLFSIKIKQNYSVIQQTIGKKRISVLIMESRTPQVNNKHITIEKCIYVTAKRRKALLQKMYSILSIRFQTSPSRWIINQPDWINNNHSSASLDLPNPVYLYKS